MQIFIDESGNLGKDGPYFVIAYHIPAAPNRLKNIFKAACLRLGGTSGPLQETKASTMEFPDKQDLLLRMGRVDDFKCGYIVAEKGKIPPALLIDKNIGYNFVCILLLKDLLKNRSDDVEIIFDNHSRKVTSTDSLEELIFIKAYGEWGFTGKLKIIWKDSCQDTQLQVVDLIANVVYGKYTYGKKNGLYEMLQLNFLYRRLYPRNNFDDTLRHRPARRFWGKKKRKV